MIMKFINGFIFTVAVLLGYMAVFSTTVSSITNHQVNKQGQIALDEDNYTHFIPTRYYHKTPLYTVKLSNETYDFDMIVYDSAYILAKKDADSDFEVIEGLSFVLIQKGQAIKNYQEVTLTLSSNKTIDFYLTRISKLNVYYLVHKETSASFVKKAFLMTEDIYDPIVNIQINQTDLSLDLDPLEESNFVLHNPLLAYVNTHKDGPSQETGVISVSPVFVVSTVGAVLLASSIYFFIVALFLVLYILYKRRKNLGRKQPTTGLEKDLERIRRK